LSFVFKFRQKILANSAILAEEVFDRKIVKLRNYFLANSAISPNFNKKIKLNKFSKLPYFEFKGVVVADKTVF
jgi:hypothetical protein